MYTLDNIIWCWNRYFFSQMRVLRKRSDNLAILASVQNLNQLHRGYSIIHITKMISHAEHVLRKLHELQKSWKYHSISVCPGGGCKNYNIFQIQRKLLWFRQNEMRQPKLFVTRKYNERCVSSMAIFEADKQRQRVTTEENFKDENSTMATAKTHTGNAALEAIILFDFIN